MKKKKVEYISCPYCRADTHTLWAQENGYNAVKCNECGFVYVNPRPSMRLIAQGVETGVHEEVSHNRTAINRRVSSRVSRYRDIIQRMFADVWNRKVPVSWLDVGAGYGEVVEAIIGLAAPDSTIEGIEPMTPKATQAQQRGIPVTNKYLHEVDRQYDFISLINVLSHIPDFRSFMLDMRAALKEGGEILIETGNIADLDDLRDVNSELDLPDHLVFCGESHIRGFLEEAGFEIIDIERVRRDNMYTFAKNVVKVLLGRSIHWSLPYTSAYRSLLVRAKLRTTG